MLETPEESVRQHLITLMVSELGYPKSGFAVEKALNSFPHLKSSKATLPTRRLDVVYLCSGIHPSHALYPLLLIECKAVKLTSAVINQVIGYNAHMQAFALAVANQEEVRTGLFNKEKNSFEFVSGMPSFSQIKELGRVIN